MDERKKHGWPFWLAAAMIVAVPVLYVAGFGPACWFQANLCESGGLGKWFAIYYPLNWAANSNAYARDIICSYGRFWTPRGKYLVLPGGSYKGEIVIPNL